MQQQKNFGWKNKNDKKLDLKIKKSKKKDQSSPTYISTIFAHNIQGTSLAPVCGFLEVTGA